MDVQITRHGINAGNPYKWAFLVARMAVKGPWRREKNPTRDTTQWVFHMGWVKVYFMTLEHWGHRTKRWKERLQALLLILTFRPVYVEFSSFCCDTGNFSWADRFNNGLEAWKHMRPEALDGGDGPTYARVMKDQESIDYYFPPPCDHEYFAGPVGSCGVSICFKCGHHEGLARCFCGWAASGGDGARELEAMGETL